jgi:transcriptional regulator with XRE-family HTH domain
MTLTKTPIPARFKSARLMNGYTLERLAEALDYQMSRQTLLRYENGSAAPDADMLARLCGLLKVNVDYFYRESRVRNREIRFWQNSHLPRRDVPVIQETVKEYLSNYIELEEILEMPHGFVHPLKDAKAVTSYAGVEEAARVLRGRWSLGSGPIPNLTALLEERNIKVVRLDVSELFDGFRTFVIQVMPVIVYNVRNAGSPDQVRHKLLHRLSQLLLTFGAVSSVQKAELQQQFIGAVLLPEDALKTELGIVRKKLSVAELGQIKRRYGISMEGIVKRAQACGIITKTYAQQFLSFMQRMDWIGKEPTAYEGTEESGRFIQMLFRGVIEGKISVSRAAALSNQSLSAFLGTHPPSF